MTSTATPCLIIGAGGTGMLSLRLLRALAESNPDLKHQIDDGTLYLVGIDSDTERSNNPKSTVSEELRNSHMATLASTAWPLDERLPVLDNVVSIDSKAITAAVDTLQFRERELPPDEERDVVSQESAELAHESIAKWFPGRDPETGEEITFERARDGGSAQWRPLGRVGLFLNAAKIFERLQEGINTVRARTHSSKPVRAIIVCSLGGGTGSGMFWDLAFMLSILEPTIISDAMFLLAEPFAAADNGSGGRLQPNTYAALKEIAAWKNWRRVVPVRVDYPVSGQTRAFRGSSNGRSVLRRVLLFPSFPSKATTADPAQFSIELACFRLAENLLTSIRKDVCMMIDAGAQNGQSDASYLASEVGSGFVFSTSSTSEFGFEWMRLFEETAVQAAAYRLARELGPSKQVPGLSPSKQATQSEDLLGDSQWPADWLKRTTEAIRTRLTVDPFAQEYSALQALFSGGFLSQVEVVKAVKHSAPKFYAICRAAFKGRHGNTEGDQWLREEISAAVAEFVGSLESVSLPTVGSSAHDEVLKQLKAYAASSETGSPKTLDWPLLPKPCAAVADVLQGNSLSGVASWLAWLVDWRPHMEFAIKTSVKEWAPPSEEEIRIRLLNAINTSEPGKTAATRLIDEAKKSNQSELAKKWLCELAMAGVTALKSPEQFQDWKSAGAIVLRTFGQAHQIRPEHVEQRMRVRFDELLRQWAAESDARHLARQPPLRRPQLQRERVVEALKWFLDECAHCASSELDVAERADNDICEMINRITEVREVLDTVSQKEHAAQLYADYLAVGSAIVDAVAGMLVDDLLLTHDAVAARVESCSTNVFRDGVCENSVWRRKLVVIPQRSTRRADGQPGYTTAAPGIRHALTHVARNRLGVVPTVGPGSDRPVIFLLDMNRFGGEIRDIDLLDQAYHSYSPSRRRLFHIQSELVDAPRLTFVRRDPVLCGNVGCSENIANHRRDKLTCPGCNAPIRNRCGNLGCSADNVADLLEVAQAAGGASEGLRDLVPQLCPECSGELRTYWWRCVDPCHREPNPTDKHHCKICVEEYLDGRRTFQRVSARPNLDALPCPGCLRMLAGMDAKTRVPIALQKYFLDGVDGHQTARFRELTGRLRIDPFRCSNSNVVHLVFPTCPVGDSTTGRHHLYRTRTGRFACTHHVRERFYACSNCSYPIWASDPCLVAEGRTTCPRCLVELGHCHYCSTGTNSLHRVDKNSRQRQRCPHCSNWMDGAKMVRGGRFEALFAEGPGFCANIFGCRAGAAAWFTEVDTASRTCKACDAHGTEIRSTDDLRELVDACPLCLLLLGTPTGLVEEMTATLAFPVLHAVADQFPLSKADSTTAFEHCCPICNTYTGKVTRLLHDAGAFGDVHDLLQSLHQHPDDDAAVALRMRKIGGVRKDWFGKSAKTALQLFVRESLGHKIVRERLARIQGLL